MQRRFLPNTRQGLVLGIALLALPAGPAAAVPALPTVPRSPPALGAYLAGTVAGHLGDSAAAADLLLDALAHDPDNPALLQPAFLFSTLAGNRQAPALAARAGLGLLSQLVLADDRAIHGDWAGAAAGFAALPHTPLNDLIRPLLLSWAQQGEGRTDLALQILAAVGGNSPLAGTAVLQAGTIAELAGRTGAAASLYRTAQALVVGSSLPVTQVLGSFLARHGQAADARAMVGALVQQVPALGLIAPALSASLDRPVVANPRQGLAHAYLAIAALLQSQDASAKEAVSFMLRFALDLQPDFAAARLMMAEQLTPDHPQAALAALAGVAPDDPLAPLVRLRAAALLAASGHQDQSRTILEALVRQFPDSPEPAQELGDVLSDAKLYVPAITAYDRAITDRSRLGNGLAGNDWQLLFSRAVALDRQNQLAAGGGGPGAGAGAGAGRAVPAELSRLQPGGAASGPRQGPDADPARPRRQAGRRLDPRQPRLGDAAAEPGAGGGPDAGTRGRGDARGPYRELPPRHRLLGGRPQGRGRGPMAVGAGAEARTRRRGADPRRAAAGGGGGWWEGEGSYPLTPSRAEPLKPIRSERAHAKVNLTLHVVGRREDGYHLLDSLVAFAGAHDLLTAEPRSAPDLTLALEGRFGAGLDREPIGDNLVLRAARRLQQALGVATGAALRLDKRLPVASGIGGGSADAAAALRLLARLWEGAGSLDREGMQPLALALGADVPVCLAQRPARMRGVGEVLDAAPALPPCALVLVNCGLAVPTPAVFGARAHGFREPAVLPAAWPDAAAMAADLARLHNDLQPAAIALCPPIADVLAAIAAQPGCLLARMSGSGATCFGLFARPEQAAAADATLARPDWWVWSGLLLSNALPSEAVVL